MKTEERKKEDCKLLDEFRHHWLNSHRLKYFYESDKLMIDERLNQFKADNDLLPKQLELSKEEWNERIGEVQVKINELEQKLNELRKLV